jgi:hypothetical protein
MSTLLLSAISSQPAIPVGSSQDKIRRIMDAGWSSPSQHRDQLMTLQTTVLSLTLDRLRGMLGLRTGQLSVASNTVAELLLEKPRTIPNFDVLWTVIADKLESGHLVLPLTEPSSSSTALTASSASAATSWGRISVWQVAECAMQLLRILAVLTGEGSVTAPSPSVRSVTERIGTTLTPSKASDETGEELGSPDDGHGNGDDKTKKTGGFFSRNKKPTSSSAPIKKIATLK